MTVSKPTSVSKRPHAAAPWRWRLRRWWSRARWGVPVPPSMLPMFGTGQFVDVIRRGPYLDIIDHRSAGMVRLIPYQPNHGVMVEYWQGGKLHSRTHLDFAGFKKIARWAGEDE